MEKYGENPSADREILKVNGLGSAEVLFFVEQRQFIFTQQNLDINEFQFLSIALATMDKCGGGQIIVISSSQGYRPIPYLASYCASKVS